MTVSRSGTLGLTPREQLVLLMRHTVDEETGRQVTFKQIADHLDLSVQRVMQIYEQARRRARRQPECPICHSILSREDAAAADAQNRETVSSLQTIPMPRLKSRVSRQPRNTRPLVQPTQEPARKPVWQILCLPCNSQEEKPYLVGTYETITQAQMAAESHAQAFVRQHGEMFDGFEVEFHWPEPVGGSDTPKQWNPRIIPQTYRLVAHSDDKRLTSQTT